MLALIVGLVLCVAAGTATYVGIVQPYLSRGSTIGWVAGTVAVAFTIRAVIGATFQRSSYVFPDPLPFHDVGRSGFVRIGGAQVQARAFFVIGLAVALALGSAWFLSARGIGRALRAVADDAEGRPLRRRARRAAGRARVRSRRRARDDRRDRRCSGRGGQREHRHPARAQGARGGARSPVRAAVVGLRRPASFSAWSRPPSPTSTSGAGSSGPRTAEVLPIAFVLLFISLWPSPEALEERE